jgi:hypothetical protein
MSLFYCRYAIAVIFVLQVGFAQPALAINFIDNCSDVPSAAGTWFGTCPPYYNNETNWEGNVLPGPSDNAILGAEYGPVEVNGVPVEATVLSVQAMGGLIIDYSSYGLILTNGGSTIDGLQMGPGNITAESGVIVSLLGSSSLWGYLNGPGTFDNSGTISMNGCRLWNAGVLVNNGSATHTAGIVQLGDGNTVFVNTGSYDVSGAAGDIRGGGSLFANNGSFTLNQPGDTFPLSPDYEQRGSLLVEAGTFHLNSATVDFISGSVTVNSGATLQLSTNQGNPYHVCSGAISMGGDGLVENYVALQADAPLILNVGSGDPDTGTGGFRNYGSVHPGGNITNTGRFRFFHGAIELGGGGEFINAPSGWAYTGSTGGATISALTRNQGNFRLGGGSMSVSSWAGFINEGSFHITAGNMSGVGGFLNRGLVRAELNNPEATSYISLVFVPDTEFGSGGTVHAVVGNLNFNIAITGLDEGTLERGLWIADPGATIRFPHTVTRLSGSAILVGDKASFTNVSLDSISGNGELTTREWDSIGDLFLEDGELNVELGGNGVQVNGTLTNGSGGNINIAPGAQLDANQLDNGEDGFESVIPELAPITVIAKVSAPPVIVTPLLNNHGRILPGGWSEIGTMHLIGNLVHQEAGELDIDLGLDQGEGQQDQLTIDGNATLAGSITVHLQPEFWPTVGQEFTILTTTGTIAGSIATINQAPGAVFSLRHEANRVVLITEEVSGLSPVPSLLTNFHLSPAYPNPFNPSTTIGFNLQRELPVDLRVFDVAGRLVRVISQGQIYAAGPGEVRWDGRSDTGDLVSAGVYFYRLQAGEFTDTRRMSLIK